MPSKKIQIDPDFSYVGTKIPRELDVAFHGWCKKYRRHKGEMIQEMIEDLMKTEEEDWS